MKTQRKANTNFIIKMIHNEREKQKKYRYDDKSQTKGELISAAVSYADLARQQVLTRDHSKLDNTKKDPYNNGYVPPGGLDSGYSTHHGNQVPTTWPYGDNKWYPHMPKKNLVRAAALIIAELERMENADREAIAVQKKRKEKFLRIKENPYYPNWPDPRQSVSVSDGTGILLGGNTVIYNTGAIGTDPTHGGKVYSYQVDDGTAETYTQF